MNIYLDMDGTFVDLYGRESWLEEILSENISCFQEAVGKVKLNHLATVLNKLRMKGATINIISWTPKNVSKEYCNKVATTKRIWLKQHLPSVYFDNVLILDYGAEKQPITSGINILFDDEDKNREKWKGYSLSEENIINKLYELLDILKIYNRQD